MKEFKELISATAKLFMALSGGLLWIMAIAIFTIILALIPVFGAAGIYWLICVIRHTQFEWIRPIAAGLFFDILVACTVIDEDLL